MICNLCILQHETHDPSSRYTAYSTAIEAETGRRLSSAAAAGVVRKFLMAFMCIFESMRICLTIRRRAFSSAGSDAFVGRPSSAGSELFVGSASKAMAASSDLICSRMPSAYSRHSTARRRRLRTGESPLACGAIISSNSEQRRQCERVRGYSSASFGLNS